MRGRHRSQPPLRPFLLVLLARPLPRRRRPPSPQPHEQQAFRRWHRELILRGDLPYVHISPPE